MMDPYFSVTYVDTNETEEQLDNVVKQLSNSVFPFAVDATVYKNEDFEKSARRKTPYNFIKCSKFRVELEMEEEVVDHVEEFREGIARFLIALRTNDRDLAETTLSDDFLIEKLGWIRSKDNPKPTSLE